LLHNPPSRIPDTHCSFNQRLAAHKKVAPWKEKALPKLETGIPPPVNYMPLYQTVEKLAAFIYRAMIPKPFSMVSHGNDQYVRPLPHFLTRIENSGAKRTI